ncbi:MAG: ATP-dependent 6-phosphofructokinase [Spirochaetales bacterium]|nr:ATP-dependent 6-phosphofructokinase [Spirochaetales bacterium]
MENIIPNSDQLIITRLGPACFNSPLKLSTIDGDNIANYVDDDDKVLFDINLKNLREAIVGKSDIPAFELAGPRDKLFFDPAKSKAAIVTCGGLCPGLNNVIRSLVMTLHYNYGLRNILGIPYGYRGLVPGLGPEPINLTPDFVKQIHERGGSVLASSRGQRDVGQIVDFLVSNRIDILFTIGGDGTQKGAFAIFQEIQKRNLPISIIGVPKTIDNDIAFVEKTFGLETAFSVAGEAIRSAHVEAVGAPHGVGIVKVMGRHCGYIAANAALAMNEVNFVLIPEIAFDLEGPKGLFALLEKRLAEKDHAVIVIAEGAGQNHLEAVAETDGSGNKKLGDIGLFMTAAIKTHFLKIKTEVSVKYIDPSYMVRSVPANSHDAIFCMQLAQNAVHAAMAGKTGLIIGTWHNHFTHVPMSLSVGNVKRLDPEEPLWLSVIEATGQPFMIKNA